MKHSNERRAVCGCRSGVGGGRRRCTAQSRRPSRRVRRPGAQRPRGGADRSDGPVGLDRHRGLAVSDGDAAGRRPRGLQPDAGRSCNRQCVGPCEGRGRGQPVQSVWRPGDHANAGPTPDLVARRLDVEDRDGCRPANALAAFRAGSCCGATVAARLVARRVVAARRRPGPAARERHTEGDDDESHGRAISARTAFRTALPRS